MLLTAGTTAVPVLAMIDSGASRTMFPKQIATQLGVTLTQDAIGASGVEGGGFPTWSSVEPITGQIIRINPQNMQAELWGPQFRLMPAFADKDPFLLGRQDFFAALPVRFQPGATPMFIIGG